MTMTPHKREQRRQQDIRTNKQEHLAFITQRRRARTPEQQLQELDRRFGPGLGATKERARLQLLIETTTRKGSHVTIAPPAALDSEAQARLEALRARLADPDQQDASERRQRALAFTELRELTDDPSNIREADTSPERRQLIKAALATQEGPLVVIA